MLSGTSAQTKYSDNVAHEPFKKGLHRLEILPGIGVPPVAFGFGLKSRPYLLYVPATYKADIPIALWIHCPGSEVKMDTVYHHNVIMAERHTVAMIVLSGLWDKMGVGWDAHSMQTYPDDVAYTRVVLGEVLQKINVDMKRITCVGFSRGARFCSRLASELSSFITAIAAVGGIRYPRPNNASRPVPVIAFHGVQDPINPFWGGGPAYWDESVPDVMQHWSRFNKCRKVNLIKPRKGVEVTRYSNCENKADVVLVKLMDWGHDWPSNEVISTRLDILQFFEDHPGKGGCFTVTNATKRFRHCLGHIIWAKQHGIQEQPTLYDGLSTNSSLADFQMVLHRHVFSDCPLPCNRKGPNSEEVVDITSEFWKNERSSPDPADHRGLGSPRQEGREPRPLIGPRHQEAREPLIGPQASNSSGSLHWVLPVLLAGGVLLAFIAFLAMLYVRRRSQVKGSDRDSLMRSQGDGIRELL